MSDDVYKISHWIPVSSELMRDQSPTLEELIEGARRHAELRRQLVAEDRARHQPSFSTAWGSR